MKLMTYNLLNGAADTYEKVVTVVKEENPDFLTLNETNGFEKNEMQKLKDFATQTHFSNFHLALSGEGDYHVAVFSKKPFKELREIRPLARAGVLATVDSEFGELCIVGTHLTPYTETARLPEIDLLTKEQGQYIHKVLMGDLNSLSFEDNYEEKIVQEFNPMQLKKFTFENKLCFDVTRKLKEYRYVDPAVLLGKNDEKTAPTHVNELEAHSNMRLDYILVSDSLKSRVSDYAVVKNSLTNVASDHYPVTVTLN